MEQKVKKGLFLLLLGLLTLPAIQHKFRFFKERELKGYAIQIEKPKLNVNAWCNGQFQQQEELYLNNHVGFRPELIRLNNELNYTLFDKLSTAGVLVGKDGYLFEESYLKSVVGEDFIGEDSVRYKVQLLKQLQDKLSAQGKHVLFVIAPGKGHVFADKLPEAYARLKKHTTNYTAFSNEMNRVGIPMIDFNKYILENQTKAKAPWMCKTGIHWSNYFEFIAGDSVFNYCKTKWNVILPKLIIDSLGNKPGLNNSDEDMEESLNLLRDLPNFNMRYPRYHFDREKKKSDPKILFVGDSFNSGIFNNYFSHLEQPQFWYYNKEVHYAVGKQPMNPKDLDLNVVIKERKVIVLLFTESNLKNFGYGFIERALLELR